MSERIIKRYQKLNANMKCTIKRVPYKNLYASNWSFIFDFIEQNDHLSDQEFKAKANYLFLDVPVKHKNYINIIEVLMALV